MCYLAYCDKVIPELPNAEDTSIPHFSQYKMCVDSDKLISLILKCSEVIEYSNTSSVLLNGSGLDMLPDPLPDVVSVN